MTDRVSAAQRAAIDAIAPCLGDDAYLAGGVAVALDLEHRASLDVDVFVATNFDPARLAARLAERDPSARVVSQDEGTLYAEVRGVPLSVIAYRHPLLAPARTKAGIAIRVASLDDLLCMKLAAVAGRGAAKDFWDLHALLGAGAARGDLRTALELFRRKYPSQDVGHIVRSLVYFADADAAPFPLGLDAAKWTEVRADLEHRVLALA